MRQILTTRNGGVEVLKVVEKTKPTPKAGEVVISVKTSGLNFADILARQGLYPDAPNWIATRLHSSLGVKAYSAEFMK